MRGKRIGMAVDAIGNRIIPAHAGQTRCERCRRYGRADHPRACGANTSTEGNADSTYGSSPRMRGKQRAFIENTLKPRIIPAHAGQTDVARWSGNWRTDHPRACGANSALRPSNILQSGSSPRMRGKPRLCTAAISALRIIPAHAGQTCGGRRGPACSADHPRACGANIGVDVSDAFGCGSSPRMRGKLPCARSGRRLRRIIPAHAGQTTS